MKKYFALVALFYCPSLFAGENQPFLLRGHYIAATWADTAAVKIGNSEIKSESKAFGLSFWYTVIPTATLIGSPFGLIAGPSMGYFYGGMPGRAWTGIGLRTVGLGGMVLAFGLTYANDPEEGIESGLVAIGLVGGGVITVFSIFHDIATVKKAVRKRNAKLQETGWLLAPKYFAKHKAHGLELQLRF